MRYTKKGVSKTHTLQKKQAIETVPEEPHMLDLGDKDVKLAIISMFKVLKKVMSKELRKA